MAATTDLTPPTTPEGAVPAAPPLSPRPVPTSTLVPVSAPAPVPVPAPVADPAPVSAPTPVYVPVATLAPPPARAPEVEVHVGPVAEPLFTIKVWQLGSAVIAVMLVALYALGIF